MFIFSAIDAVSLDPIGVICSACALRCLCLRVANCHVCMANHYSFRGSVRAKVDRRNATLLNKGRKFRGRKYTALPRMLPSVGRISVCILYLSFSKLPFFIWNVSYLHRGEKRKRPARDTFAVDDRSAFGSQRERFNFYQFNLSRSGEGVRDWGVKTRTHRGYSSRERSELSSDPETSWRSIHTFLRRNTGDNPGCWCNRLLLRSPSPLDYSIV